MNEDGNPLQRCFALVELAHFNNNDQPEFSPPVLGRTLAELEFGTGCV